MSEWQPIETAPKDGTRILTCYQCNTGPVIEIAAWGQYGRRSHAWKHDYAAGRKMFLAPEWWQPLPVPPNPRNQRPAQRVRWHELLGRTEKA